MTTNSPINERWEGLQPDSHDVDESSREDDFMELSWQRKEKARRTTMESDADNEASVAGSQPRMLYSSTTSGIKVAPSKRNTGLFGNMASTSTAVPVSGSNTVPVWSPNPLPQWGTGLFGNIPVSSMMAPTARSSATAMDQPIQLLWECQITKPVPQIWCPY